MPALKEMGNLQVYNLHITDTFHFKIIYSILNSQLVSIDVVTTGDAERRPALARSIVSYHHSLFPTILPILFMYLLFSLVKSREESDGEGAGILSSSFFFANHLDLSVVLFTVILCLDYASFYASNQNQIRFSKKR